MARKRKDGLEQAIEDALAPGAFIIGYRDNGGFVEDVRPRTGPVTSRAPLRTLVPLRGAHWPPLQLAAEPFAA